MNLSWDAQKLLHDARVYMDDGGRLSDVKMSKMFGNAKREKHIEDEEFQAILGSLHDEYGVNPSSTYETINMELLYIKSDLDLGG